MYMYMYIYVPSGIYAREDLVQRPQVGPAPHHQPPRRPPLAPACRQRGQYRSHLQYAKPARRATKQHAHTVKAPVILPRMALTAW